MAKRWVLDTETKGTGANMVPLEKKLAKPEPPAPSPAPPPPPKRRLTPLPSTERARTATALPPGHVRKKSTGELGKVQAVDAKAGTVTVRWLRGGATSTVPLASVSRR
ncbi:MAG: hypothetical protein JW895_12030 [Thermoleophilaceae bacterium]|nr:hypothetical protein [Thermoleophilaceae bacterium]